MARGTLFVMTGASGVGKGTIRAQVMGYLHKSLHYSISMTTRAPRPGEKHGQDYYFVSKEEFEARIARNGFLEHAEFVGNYYGTPREPVEEALDRGLDVLLEIEVQGALQVAERAPDAVMIFIVPPSLSELKHRLLLRGTESLEKIEKRLAQARREMEAAHNFHYVVVNDELGSAVNDFMAVIRAERLRYPRMREAIAQALTHDPEIDAENAVLEETIRKAGS